MANSKYIENDFLNIARGHVKGVSSVHKFGAVPAMSTGATGTVWDLNDTPYPWDLFDSDTTPLVVTAADALDSGETVTLSGLDTDYNELTEDVVITSSGVTTDNVFKRINRAFLTTKQSNVDNINITKNGIVVARITEGQGQTLMSVYTIPNNKTCYLTQGVMSCQDGADASGNMFYRFNGQETFRIATSFEVSGDGGPYIYKFTVPQVLPEKTDIDVRASVRSNNARIAAAFDMILIDDGDVS